VRCESPAFPWTLHSNLNGPYPRPARRTCISPLSRRSTFSSLEYLGDQQRPIANNDSLRCLMVRYFPCPHPIRSGGQLQRSTTHIVAADCAQRDPLKKREGGLNARKPDDGSAAGIFTVCMADTEKAAEEQETSGNPPMLIRRRRRTSKSQLSRAPSTPLVEEAPETWPSTTPTIQSMRAPHRTSRMSCPRD
jgi:hypothetical protein